ncbi:metal ABC transporter solute-binding protein, Zn/Mn family [Microbacterium sp. NPDC078428]|uniref:metal ABC transporter solute-binding protein, Zn/Mn family n=1 Tax=Microbacterium sp. NPDC078428 TaxID=3364190 RepID=UPI0037C66CF1
MTRYRRILPLFALPAASALVLAGCAGGTDAAGPGDDAITVVASTNVYGDIAQQVVGDVEGVDVESIITSGAQDPHDYEPSAQDQLTVSRADLIIENGGGYDSFIDALIDSSGTDAHVITAAESSHDWPGEDGGDSHDHSEEEHSEEEHAAEEGHDHSGHDHIEGFNEHVWYDPHTIEHVAEHIAEELGELVPAEADTFLANAEQFAAEIAGLEESLAIIASENAGAAVFVTEPVPVYLVSAAELENVTPEAFSEAVEEGQDVPPATLLEALGLLESGDVRVVIANAQTGGAETTQVIDAAETAGIPVIEFTETLPEGQTYISWMQENIEALAGALAE